MQLKQKDIKTQRDKMLLEQNNACPLCQLEVDVPVLDHSHKNEPNPQHIRAVLCRTCNSSLGSVFSKLQRSGLINKLGLDGAINWLYNASVYYQQDYSMNPYHPNRTLDLMKHFKQQSKLEQLKLLEEAKQEIPLKATKHDLECIYKKYIRTL